MRVIALAAVLFLLMVAANWGTAGAVSGSARVGPTGAHGPTGPLSHVKTRWRATVAALPANAATGESQAVDISSISCASPRNCSAVGSYVNDAGDREGLLLTEKAGHWKTGVEAVLPVNAASEPQVGLTSVSCASKGNCTAVGTYLRGDGSTVSGLLLTQTAGHWAAGVEAVPPEAAFGVDLHAVSCSSAGNCTAVGSYTNNTHTWGVLLTEKAGRWKPGVAYGWDADRAVLLSVSCAPDGSCGAVGYMRDYVDDGRDSYETGSEVLLTKRRYGGWIQEFNLLWPDDEASGDTSTLTSVSCPSAGNCSATGVYGFSIDSSVGPRGALFTEKAGTWRQGVRVKLPKGVPPSGYNAVDMVGISCASSGECGAIATVYPGGLMLLTKTAGDWQRGFEPSLSHGAYDPAGAAISCASPRNCTVVGTYGNADRGLLLTEIAGRWARGVKAPHFSGSLDSVSSVSCSAPGTCGAVGVDWTSGGPTHGVLLDSTTPPCVVPRLKGMTVPKARHSIESHNCFVGTIAHARSATIETGRVISQKLRPGRHFAPGTRVSLTVGRGP